MTFFCKNKAVPASPSRPRGFTLIEVLLVLGVAAVLIVASFAVYTQVTRASQVREAQSMVRTVAANIRATFPHGDYSSLNNKMALDAKIVDGSYRTNPSNPRSTLLTHPWGGNMTISGTDETANTGVCGPSADQPRCTHFRIVMAGTGVPSQACVDMLTGIGGEFDIVWAIHAGNPQGGNQPNLVENGYPDVEKIVEECNDAEKVNIRFVAR